MVSSCESSSANRSSSRTCRSASYKASRKVGGRRNDEEPALVQRDLRGDLVAWIEIGAPTPDRLHKATKLAPRVVVYTWQAPEKLAAAIAERGVHRADRIELCGFDPAFLDAAAATLDRVNRWELSVSGGTLYLSIGGALHESAVRRVSAGG